MPRLVRLEDAGDPLDRLRRCIATPPENSRVFEITPDMAKTILEDYNEGNRPRKPSKISEYADDMANDRWPVTGDTLKFSDRKPPRLRDGQNRLMACVRAGVPFTSHIVFGIPDSAFDVLDKGKNRSGSDILAIAGFGNTAVMAGALRWLHLLDTGRAKQRDSMKPSVLLDLVRDKYPTLPDYVKQARVIYEHTGQPISLVLALLYAFHRANEPAAREFAMAWETGERGGRFKPIALMQSQVAQLQAASSGRVHDVVRAALIVKAWNLYIRKRKGSAVEMRWRPADPFPEISS
jgi:hypothetical protein